MQIFPEIIRSVTFSDYKIMFTYHLRQILQDSLCEDAILIFIHAFFNDNTTFIFCVSAKIYAHTIIECIFLYLCVTYRYL